MHINPTTRLVNNIHRLNSPLNIIDVQYQLHDYYSTMRPQGQNVVQREVVRTVYISVYSIQETSSLIVQHIVDEAKPYHSTHTLFSFIVVPSRHDGLYGNEKYFLHLMQHPKYVIVLL